jgi:hypothetical protein
MTEEYAKIWNLDYKPNMAIWFVLEKENDERIEKELKETGVAKIGSITSIYALDHYIRKLTYDTSVTALQRRNGRKLVKLLIRCIINNEKEFMNR